MRKIVLGMVAAAVAIPTAASAQPGYYGGGYNNGGYYGGQYSRGYSPYDRNGDGVVTRREIERTQREQARYGYNGGAYGNSYGYSGGYYGNSYGGQYSSYYDRSGYYSGPTWRGNDGRYYCRRSDGSTGTLVGAGVGAVIGSQVAGRGDRTIGAILGGAVGALIGNSIDRGGSNNRYRCN